MNLLKKTYLREILSKEIELLILVSVLLFFPDKSALTYYLFIAILIIVFGLRSVFTERNLGISSFTNILISINIVFIITSMFSINKYDSLLLIADIIIISVYIFLLFTQSLNQKKLFFFFLVAISIFSFLKIINDIYSNNLEFILYKNPIRIGIVSGLGLVISLYFLIDKKKWIYGMFLFVNFISVYLSSSKGAFIGVIIISIIIVFQKHKKLLIYIALLLILTFIIPNPIKNMFNYSIYKDKYSTDRLNIWKMTINVFLDNITLGIGPNNFKNVVKKYNFKQTKGPANYFKVPKQTHNDYLKIIAENGLLGLLLVVLFLFGLIKRIKINKILDLPLLLLLFLSFQAFFFNILFKPFFLLVFLLLLKLVFEIEVKFVNITKNFKLFLSFTILFVFLAGHLLPFISNHFLNKSVNKELTFIEKDYLLNKANYFMPIRFQPLVSRSILHFNVFTKTFNFDFCFSALDLIKKAKKLAPDNPEIYNIEIQFFQYYYQPIIKMRANLKNKIVIDMFYSCFQLPDIDRYLEIKNNMDKIKGIEPILNELLMLMNEMQYVDPNNPFLRLKKAKLCLDFDKRAEALFELKNAIIIEPEYLDAILMLEREFNYFKDKIRFKATIKRIQKKKESLNRERGSYLYDLHNDSFSST